MKNAVIHGLHDGLADFPDPTARDPCLAGPDHRAIGARLVAACAGGTDGLIVFDDAL